MQRSGDHVSTFGLHDYDLVGTPLRSVYDQFGLISLFINRSPDPKQLEEDYINAVSVSTMQNPHQPVPTPTTGLVPHQRTRGSTCHQRLPPAAACGAHEEDCRDHFRCG